MSRLDFIKPAGDDTAEVVTFKGKADRKPTWCKVCGRKHPRNLDCDLVEYKQGEEYEKLVETDEGLQLRTLRHPGRHVHRESYDATKREAEDGE